MLALLIVAVVLLVAVLCARYAERRRIRLRSCCGGRPWPPDDITDRERRAG